MKHSSFVSIVSSEYSMLEIKKLITGGHPLFFIHESDMKTVVTVFIYTGASAQNKLKKMSFMSCVDET